MKITKVRPVRTPERGTEKSAGIDFFIPEDFQTQILFPQDRVNIPSGIKAKVPTGFALIAFNKSGVASNEGLVVGACVVDEDYQGEIHINLINTGSEPITLHSGKKATQFILMPIFYDGIEEVPEKDLHPIKSERGEGGFGSTGI